MKTIRFLLIIQILFASFKIANGQALITKSDSISLKKDTLVTFVVPEYRGGIQWQKSSDGTTWRNIDGKTEDFIVVEINEEYSVRAMISDGTCSPFYSDTARITFIKPEVKTVKVDSIRSFSSHLFAEIYDNGGSGIIETGFYVSDKLETLTAENNKVVNSANHGLFENRVNGLNSSTQYYMCSFATNSKGTSYGDTLIFKTKEFSIAAIDLRDQNYEWDYWVVSNDSGYFFINLENGRPVSAYVKPIPAQEGFTVFLNDQGLPYKMVIDGFILLFENFRDNLVDASIVYPSGQIEIIRDIEIDVELTGLKNIYFSPNNEWTIFGLKTVGNALRVASCIASLASIPTGVGVILAGAACSSAMLSMISQAYDLETLELVFNNISLFTDLLGCASGDVISCALLVAGTSNDLLLYLVESTKNESVSSAQLMLRMPTITTATISNIMQSTALGGEA